MRIARIRTYSLHCPLAMPVANAQGRHDEQSALLVRITTDDGLDGWGECAGPCDALSDVLLRLLAPRLVGQLADDIEIHHATMNRTVPAWARRGLVTAAMSGLDIALWDIRAKAQNRPLCEIIGGRFRDRVPCYACGLFFPSRPESEVIPTLLEEAHGYIEEGYRALKIQIGRNPTYDAAIVRAVRREFPDLTLFADACRAYDLSEALRMAHILEENHFDIFEEPLGVNSPAHLRQLADSARCLTIGAGESEQGRWEFLPLLQSGVSVLQPDATCCGGITELLKIRALATSHGVNIMPRVGETAISLAVVLHILASESRFPGRLEMPAGLLEHSSDAVTPLRDAITEEGIVVAHGVAQVPQLPGLGIAPDESALRILTLHRAEVCA